MKIGVVSIPFGASANHFATPSVGDGLLLLPGTDQVFAFMGPAGRPPPPPRPRGETSLVAMRFERRAEGADDATKPNETGPSWAAARVCSVRGRGRGTKPAAWGTSDRRTDGG